MGWGGVGGGGGEGEEGRGGVLDCKYPTMLIKANHYNREDIISG